MQQSKQPPLTQPKLMLVEGMDEVNFFNALIKHANLDGIEVRDYGGKTLLSTYLRTTLKLISGFRDVQSVGIVRDADEDAGAAFQSVCSSLANAKLPVPHAPLEPVSGTPQISVMIMPPGVSAGMLEDLCLSAFQEDAVMSCIDLYFECVDKQTGSLPRNMAKARIHVFLASRDPPDCIPRNASSSEAFRGVRLGQAVGKEFWPWDSPAFDAVKQFLNGHLEAENQEQTVLELLKIIEPNLKRLAMIVTGGVPTLHGDIGLRRLIPLAFMGDGMGRLASLAIAIANASGGVLLIDEIENGIHHSLLTDVWRGITDCARQFDVQLFATIQSYESLTEAHRAFQKSGVYDLRFYRIDRRKGSTKVHTFDEEMLEFALDANWEVR